jgi:hypothetical protein
MPYHSLSLAARGLQPFSAPTLPHRLISWITRRAPSGCTEDPVDAPLSAQALLQHLLDRHPQAREVFAHLASVEKCLQLEGVGAVGDLSGGTLQRARAELLSLAGESDVQPLLELLANRRRPPLAQEPAPSFQMRACTVAAPPRIENLEVDEVDEEAYLTALLQWDESAHASLR